MRIPSLSRTRCATSLADHQGRLCPRSCVVAYVAGQLLGQTALATNSPVSGSGHVSRSANRRPPDGWHGGHRDDCPYGRRRGHASERRHGSIANRSIGIRTSTSPPDVTALRAGQQHVGSDLSARRRGYESSPPHDRPVTRSSRSTRLPAYICRGALVGAVVGLVTVVSAGCGNLAGPAIREPDGAEVGAGTPTASWSPADVSAAPTASPTPSSADRTAAANSSATGTAATTFPPGPAGLPLVVRSGPVDHRRVALTFDADMTPELLT
jgi:hypothetical protein